MYEGHSSAVLVPVPEIRCHSVIVWMPAAYKCPYWPSCLNNNLKKFTLAETPADFHAWDQSQSCCKSYGSLEVKEATLAYTSGGSGPYCPCVFQAAVTDLKHFIQFDQLRNSKIPGQTNMINP